jgi:hypothetical protein
MFNAARKYLAGFIRKGFRIGAREMVILRTRPVLEAGNVHFAQARSKRGSLHNLQQVRLNEIEDLA